MKHKNVYTTRSIEDMLGTGLLVVALQLVACDSCYNLHWTSIQLEINWSSAWGRGCAHVIHPRTIMGHQHDVD